MHLKLVQKKSKFDNPNSGVVAQMVERSLCMREVQGSIPCISILIFTLVYIFSKSANK